MPGNKGKGKGREPRGSRSRNTTPNSALSASTAAGTTFTLGYLDHDVSKLSTPAAIQYSDILSDLGGVNQIPDPKSLETLVEQLKTLSQLAEARGDACNAGMRELSQKRKELLEEQREREQIGHPAEKLKMKREAEEDEQESRISKGVKLKKRKDKGVPKEERPLAVGAHDVARQDAFELRTDGECRLAKRIEVPRAVYVCVVVGRDIRAPAVS